MSRSQRGMNHLGSGHVLSNTRQPVGARVRTTAPYETSDATDSNSPPIGNTQSLRGRISRKSRQRERFRPGWMLTLVRQLVELEKRRRDYCSDPRESADSGRPLRPLRRSGLPARRPHQRRRAALLCPPRPQVRARTQEDRSGDTGRDRSADRHPGFGGRRRALTHRTSDEFGAAGGRTPSGGVRPHACGPDPRPRGLVGTPDRVRHRCRETSADTADSRV